MTLPLTPAAARLASGWRYAGAVLLLVLAIHIPAVPCRAQEADPFSATVKVDAGGETITKAREVARLDGQRRAFAAVAARLAPGASGKLPRLDDKALTDLVASFEVANERMSAVRYLAEYTFHFRPTEVRRVLGNPAIGTAAPEPATPAAPAEATGKPVVLLPVYQAGGQPRLWDEPNPWRDSWERQPQVTGKARIVVPMGDAADIAAIDAVRARSGDADALAAVARGNGVEEALVALATVRGPPDRPAGLDVTVRRYRAGRLVDTREDRLTAEAGESGADLLGRAAAAVASHVASGSKGEPAARHDQEGSLTAVLPIASLDDWLRARERLAGVSGVRKVALMSLSRQEATIEIGYAGSVDQLKTGLSAISLDLVRGDPLWRLAPAGPGRLP